MLYDDRERMAKFYQDAFGWQIQMLGEEVSNCVLRDAGRDQPLLGATLRQRRNPARRLAQRQVRRLPDIPVRLPEMMRDIDKAKAARAIRAILGMKKFDIAELRAAYEGSVPTPLCNLPKMMTMPVERNRARAQGRRGLLPILWLSNG